MGIHMLSIMFLIHYKELTYSHLIKNVELKFELYWLHYVFLIHWKELAHKSHLFRNWLDYIQRAEWIWDSFIQELFELYWLCYVFLIHWKELALKSHLFANWTMLFTHSHAVRTYWKMCKNAVGVHQRNNARVRTVNWYFLFIGLSL